MFDYLGNATTVQQERDLQAINDFIKGFLGYNQCIVNILPAAEKSDNGLVHTYAGLLWMLSETGDTPEAARLHAKKAETAHSLNEREKSLLDVLKLWVADDMHAVRRTLQDIQRWSPFFGQGDKLSSGLNEDGFYGQGYAETVCGRV